MNLPNRVTIFRLLIPVVFLPVLMIIFPYSKVFALALFVIGSLSDWLDGYLARKMNATSDFGRLMDPLADKIMVSAALIAFVVVMPSVVKVWMVVIIISRDFMITGLRLLAINENFVISADKAGKQKTIWQMIAIISLLLFLALQDLSHFFPDSFNQFLNNYCPVVLLILFYFVVLLTMFSGGRYMWNYRKLYLKDV